MCILRLCIAANVAAFGGRSKPERLCAFCVCALLLVTTALLMLPHWVGGVNRNACVRFFFSVCVCVCACGHLLLVTTALLMLPHWGGAG